MKEFFITLCASSILGGISAMAVGKKYGGYIKLIASLCCALLLISPFKNLKNTSFVPSFSEIDLSLDREKLTKEVEAEAINLAEDYISDTVAAYFGIKVDSVSILFDGKAAKAVVHTSGSGVPDEDVAEYITECFGMEAEVYAD